VSVRPVTGNLPKLNTPVLVSVPGLDHDLPSRVEDLRGGDVVVAAVSLGRHARVSTGETLALSWAAPPRGLMATACVLEQVVLGQPSLWVLRPVGVVRRLQRRRYARADVSARVSLSGAEALSGHGWAATGMLADLSEGGARVLLDTGQRVPVAVGDVLVVDLRVAGRPLVTIATVVGLESLAPGRHQVRLEFDLPERDSDQVRRAVMQRQVEARRGGEPS
jgi:hypothetical protein